MSADLHVHTNLSDGTETPETVVDKARAAGLKTLAITDHDTLDGVARALSRGEALGVEVIPGIEFTTETAETEIHILGYFIDQQAAGLKAEIAKLQKSRTERIFQICDKLKKLNVVLDPESVLALAGNKAPGRPHVARAMVENGCVATFQEAFNRYINFGGPAYVEHYKLAPAGAVKLVKETGGVPVYAHPAVSKADWIIPELCAAGLSGLEVYYPSHNRSQTKHYLGLAHKHGLLVTGGTDYHGAGSGREISLGMLTIKDELVDKLRDEHLHRN